MLAKGVFQPSNESMLVYEYGAMKTLKKLGFNFDPSKLSDTDMMFYSIIDDELAKVEKDEMKKARKK